jgi:hypothetical protein
MDGQFGEGVLVARGHFEREQNPIAAMGSLLMKGAPLILFPEGTRGPGSQVQPLKAGVFHLAQATSNLELVLVWIDNSYRVMPKHVVHHCPRRAAVGRSGRFGFHSSGVWPAH